MRTSCFRVFLSNGAIAVAGLLTAGCASVPRQALWHQGQMPPPGTYRIGGILADDQPAGFVPGLSNALERRGFRQSGEARYLVQIARSDRPWKTGLSVPEAELAEEQPPSNAWNRAPRRAERVRKLTISISSVRDRQELYRLQGEELYQPGKADDGGVQLTDVIIARIAGQ